MFEAATKKPVFIKHYKNVKHVLISKDMYDEWKEIVEKHKKIKK